MKRITHLTGISLLLAVTVLAHPWQKSDFSGTWVLDKDKSFSNGAGFDQTMTITHKNVAFKIEAKQKTARGEQAITEEFTLDGKVAEYNPPQPPNARGKRTASWLPNGRAILVNDEVSADGKVIRQVSRKMTLSADGKALTVDLFIDDSRGSFESKRIYNRAG